MCLRNYVYCIDMDILVLNVIVSCFNFLFYFVWVFVLYVFGVWGGLFIYLLLSFILGVVMGSVL